MVSKAKPPLKPRKNVGFKEVLERLDAHQRAYDRDFLAKVYSFTKHRHRKQRRRSGEPYITHPLYVAYILADLKLDQTCVAVGFLHDVLEDTGTTQAVLEEEFGPDVAKLVDGVTKIGQQEYVRRGDAQAETFRKMILASTRDLRVILVKLADRLHNMLTLEHKSPEARRRIATETLEIYAPIALRLGMSKLQGDLEDLAFYFRYPLQFAAIAAKLREKMRGAKGSLQRIRAELIASLEEAEIDAEISFREKRYYSIFRKLRRQGIDISQLYDYLAFRIITDDLRASYAAFGVVHQSWRPIPGRFKDYIAMPKPNGYRSLHTTVVGEKGQPFEVQIRTREMDEVAEQGVAAHWQYKTGVSDGESNAPWLQRLEEMQKDVQDPREFMATLKTDLHPDEVYVFTPRGDVFPFPRGATPLDFAYRIHTDLGHACTGARVNGRLVQLKTPLANGDMVEIMAGTRKKPSRDWLNFVVTSRARSKIRHWLNTERKREAEAIGRRLLERDLRKLRLSPRKVFEGTRMADYLKHEGYSRIEDLFQRIGYGKASVKQALTRLVDPKRLEETPEGRPGAIRQAVDRILHGPVTVKGEGDLMATLAKCCDPVPGEELVGYVTRGRGISVHSAGCPNVRSLSYDAERLVEVEWARRSDQQLYQVTLAIETEDHTGMLARLTEVIAREASNIRHFEAETVEADGGSRGLIDVVVEVRSRRHLDRLRQTIGAVDGVLQVTRRAARKSGRGGGSRRPEAAS